MGKWGQKAKIPSSEQALYNARMSMHFEPEPVYKDIKSLKDDIRRKLSIAANIPKRTHGLQAFSWSMVGITSTAGNKQKDNRIHHFAQYIAFDARTTTVLSTQKGQGSTAIDQNDANGDAADNRTSKDNPMTSNNTASMHKATILEANTRPYIQVPATPEVERHQNTRGDGRGEGGHLGRRPGDREAEEQERSRDRAAKPNAFTAGHRTFGDAATGRAMAAPPTKPATDQTNRSTFHRDTGAQRVIGHRFSQQPGLFGPKGQKSADQGGHRNPPSYIHQPTASLLNPNGVATSGSTTTHAPPGPTTLTENAAQRITGDAEPKQHAPRTQIATKRTKAQSVYGRKRVRATLDDDEGKNHHHNSFMTDF
ncbi:hypothetical protein HBH82_108030 [Parastagonospora nodorum]|nr:hypothetical protein HBH82_108030 [Parastagonospora nodorum]KAH4658731.1 hypothetical protein HBH78_237640 [Parastagonospora nodorum]KAH4697252.1 hypothetical protein HBH67_181100 [Parastagonospora nodorum]KAH4765420.1 hypothetical protein HBH63_177960 [Parastagonospora nodorum]KAH4792022.1 hypothetical protein HBH62_026550 [Parastagonospora nodorum]